MRRAAKAFDGNTRGVGLDGGVGCGVGVSEGERLECFPHYLHAAPLRYGICSGMSSIENLGGKL